MHPLFLWENIDWAPMSVTLLFSAIHQHSTEPFTFRCTTATTTLGRFYTPCSQESIWYLHRSTLKLLQSFYFSSNARPWCMNVRSPWNMNFSFISGQTDTDQGLLPNVAKSRKKKKRRANRLCTYCIPGYLYREEKLCRLHVSAWWELLNYCWMFLITSHKCWNTTLLQCLEEEGGP